MRLLLTALPSDGHIFTDLWVAYLVLLMWGGAVLSVLVLLSVLRNNMPKLKLLCASLAIVLGVFPVYVGAVLLHLDFSAMQNFAEEGLSPQPKHWWVTVGPVSVPVWIGVGYLVLTRGKKRE